MRAIVNIASASVAAAAGWRARAIQEGAPNTTLEDIFRSAPLEEEGQTLYGLVSRDGGLKPEFVLYVNGWLQCGEIDWKQLILDSEQIHVYDWPLKDN